MVDMDDNHRQLEAGPSSPTVTKPITDVPAAQPQTSTAEQSSNVATTSTSTPSQSRPSSPRSRSTSRSPSISKRPSKRSSTFSPVPEEEPPLPSSSSTTLLPSDSPSTNPARPAEEPTTKKPRTNARGTADPTTTDKRRANRLFGVLTGTLSQFKREQESSRAASLAQKRAEIEARLASKLRDEERAIGATERRKVLMWEARGFAEEIAEGDAQRRTLRGLKRRMASFLYTPTPPSGARSGRGAGEERLAAKIPLCEKMEKGRRGEEEEGGCYAVYFLPGKTLPEQEDKLNTQEDEVDDKIDRFDDDWEDKRRKLVVQLNRLKGRIRELQ